MTYVGKQDGHWIAPPAIPNTLTLPSVGRIDIFKEAVGLDLTQMYPAGGTAEQGADRQVDLGLLPGGGGEMLQGGSSVRSRRSARPATRANWVGAIFNAYGAELVDKDGNITVKSDPVKQVLDCFKKLVPFLPPDVFAWDDSSNNKALISGQAALIMNPPSAWAVAVRDAPKVAEQCWHFPSPKGPKGRFDPAQPSFWGIWNFSPNKSAAKSLALHLWETNSVEQLVAASKGYDIPCLRHAARLQDLGRRRPAQRRHLELPAARRRDRVGVRLAGAGAHRQPDLRAGDDGQDDRPAHPAG